MLEMLLQAGSIHASEGVPYWVAGPVATALIAAIVALWRRDVSRSRWFEQRVDELLIQTKTTTTRRKST